MRSTVYLPCTRRPANSTRPSAGPVNFQRRKGLSFASLSCSLLACSPRPHASAKRRCMRKSCTAPRGPLLLNSYHMQTLEFSYAHDYDCAVFQPAQMHCQRYVSRGSIFSSRTKHVCKQLMSRDARLPIGTFASTTNFGRRPVFCLRVPLTAGAEA
jgi:hypothetical protein